MKEKEIIYPIKDRWSYLWLAIGTLLGLFWTIPLTIWLGPLFLMRFMRSQKVWRGYLILSLTSFIATAYSFREPLPLPMVEYLITIAVMVLVGSNLAYLADRLLVPRLSANGRSPFVATLVFPLAFTVLDYIGAMTNPMGSIGAFAYSQYGNLPLMQLLSITGMWGIVFLVTWFASIVNWVWENSFEWKEIRAGVAVYGGILLAVLLFGGARLAFAPEPSGTFRVHGITAVDMRQDLYKLHEASAESREAFRRVSAEMREPYLEATLREAKGGAQLVVWPEMAVQVPVEDEAEFFQRAAEIARSEGVYLAIPLVTAFDDDRLPINKIVIVDPNGEIVLDHHKYGYAAFEGFQPGDGVYKTVESPFGTLSGIVCNDTNHQEMVSQAGRNSTDILITSSMEYRGIDPIHAHMAIYRAIENGVTVIRQADNGLSVVVDPYGRVVASMDHFNASERVLVAQAPVNYSVTTLYSYTPDWFAWLAAVGFVAIAIVAIVQGRKAKRVEVVKPASQPAA